MEVQVGKLFLREAPTIGQYQPSELRILILRFENLELRLLSLFTNYLQICNYRNKFIGICCMHTNLHARSLPSHPGHQRSQFPPLYGTGSPLSLLPVLPLSRSVHSWWLALPCGMDFHWHSDCSPGFFLTHSTLA